MPPAYPMMPRHCTQQKLGGYCRRVNTFYQSGGFPESLRYISAREYAESVYQKVLLGDIVARNGVRNPDALRVLMKKIAEIRLQ